MCYYCRETTAGHEAHCPCYRGSVAGFIKVGPTIKLGWKCPQCGRVYGPQVNECTYCNAKSIEDRLWGDNECDKGVKITTSCDNWVTWTGEPYGSS